MVKATTKIETLAQWYGYAGLMPFILLALVIVSGAGLTEPARVLFDAYSAIILSFMAGIYWPIALREEGPASPVRILSACVSLALWGWFALMFPEMLRAASFVVAFIILYGIDRYVLEDRWTTTYLRMRMHLTAVVVASQFLVMLLG